ncbi:diphthine methyltransferase isoform X1 [Ooceraea biroi]|uniref:methylated diphthine methylhydrolase n=2 Tax=Ooceraea biroi TaxID=2015173 RepID=A0A026W0H8_OOCBI|nr:diphthine methyltransferase isoform X1 [Ooceraea biroi]XP_019888874.1 diphthine methyltransferase isoform X1 [Ooceraea biroi]XP_019888875.1 diphthine methyltransferase isoform X1 [Ooceraea biroi]XP_026825950.1 diphthine methyltransferase isoform X1 [Ooceraea biroi]XP_026825951.1 diphthine methyltransferase isoform X1 [Ooceraea biroi]EZA49577.1 WD repeat-containing protein [Ooceraea biroi]
MDPESSKPHSIDQSRKMRNLASFSTMDTFNTELPADSVEWCPIEPFQNVFACGTYKLIEDEEKDIKEQNKTCERIGRIYLFCVVGQTDNNENKKLLLLQQLESPGVLDMKWTECKNSKQILLAVATSIGDLQLFQLKVIEDATKLVLIAQEKVCDGLALSLDWSIGTSLSSSHQTIPHIAVSDSQGQISHFTYHCDTNNLTSNFTCRAHKFEAWIVAFDYWDENVFYSGGDDHTFQSFDARIGPKSVMCNKFHNAGVTSIQSNVGKPFVLATGSYDEFLRLWDKRNLRAPLSRCCINSGIWRLKWDFVTHNFLLAACMYDGFKIVDCSHETMEPCIISNYREHDSLAYGCDWSFLPKKDLLDLDIHMGDALVGTCSFKDCALKLSSVQFTMVDEQTSV